MDTDRNVLAIADVAEDQSHMFHVIKLGLEGHGAGWTMAGIDRKILDLLDQTLDTLTIGNEISYRNMGNAMLLGKGDNVWAFLDRTIIIDQLGDNTNRWQTGQIAQIHSRFGVT